MTPTQEDVARRAGVSRALVSLVMRDSPHVSPKRRKKVLKAAEELGYRPNAHARSLASKQVHTFGVLIHDVTNPYFASVYTSVARAAEQSGYDLLLAAGTASRAREATLVSTLFEHRIAGLVLLSPLMGPKTLRGLAQSVPVVVVGSGAPVAGIDAVTTDEEQAATEVIEHLAALGHRDIIHVSGGNTRPGRARTAGFEAAMGAAGLRPTVLTGDFTADAGREAGHTILGRPHRPTAVVAANDLVAVGVMGVLRANGINVPDDISVVGYDDSQIASLDLVDLTTVRQPVEHFGTAAIARLVERATDPDARAVVQRLPASLVVRGTTGPARVAQRLEGWKT